MSLLKRIESARPGSTTPNTNTPVPSNGGGPVSPVSPPSAPSSNRMMSQAPVRESFRDREAPDPEPRSSATLIRKLDLSNQVEVRRQIEEIFGNT